MINTLTTVYYIVTYNYFVITADMISVVFARNLCCMTVRDCDITYRRV